MKALIKLDLAGFHVPDCIGGKPFPRLPQAPQAPAMPGAYPSAPSYPFEIPLGELAPEALDELCADFRRAVFKKANKPFPPEQGRSTEKPLAALDRLKSVLCDPGGMISIVGSDGDAAVIKRALQDLDTFLNSI